MRKKIIFYAGILVCLIAIPLLYYYYKPRTTAANQNADYRIDAPELYNAFALSEAEATNKYSGKILEVSGRITEMQLKSPQPFLLLGGGNNPGGVNCSLATNPSIDIQTGDSVIVRGTCTGYLMDVNLADVVIIQK